ncbi:MAG: 1,4-alpha-glucan branching protein GlgB [Thermoguttaceae bacterium]|nr:1,4-alpha-glucan branching protein GlgB [Thermoguttaceae bacterium]
MSTSPSNSNAGTGKSPAPTAFSSVMAELDFYLFGEGTHWELYNKLGAHLRTVDGVEGVNFLVWAPNATRVSVVGNFNGWNAEANVMFRHNPSGLWEAFVPGIGTGTLYKYRVESAAGIQEKVDPVGFQTEVPPRTASIVADLDSYAWNDQEWLARREKNDTSWLHSPVSIYEVHLGSWIRSPDDPDKFLSYRDLAPKLIEYVKKIGYTHIELLPLAEHPLAASWGYQVIGYFAATGRFGTPEDLMYLVDQCHQNGIGVLLDWVPAHFPKDAHGLARFDGTALYEHADPRQGEHRDWGTYIFNFGRTEVRNFLVSNALFWLDKYHIDGLRVDAVASMLYLDYSRKEGEWIPNKYGGRENLEAIDFLRVMNEQTHTRHKGILTIAEESTSWGGVTRPGYTGGLGFSMKWNMGWMHDTLQYFRRNPIHRKYHHNQLTFSLLYAFSENFVLPISHDEVVHGKGSIISDMPGDLWQKFANARLLYGYMWTHPGKKLLFMGCDFGQWNEWDFNKSLDWHLLQFGDTHGGLQKCLADLNALYKSEKALYEYDFDQRGFEWVDCNNWGESVLAYVRRAKDPGDWLLVTINATPVARRCRFGLPEGGDIKEIFCSDAPCYGGSGLGNGTISGEAIPWQGRPFSAEILLAPLAVSIFKPSR